MHTHSIDTPSQRYRVKSLAVTHLLWQMTGTPKLRHLVVSRRISNNSSTGDMKRGYKVAPELRQQFIDRIKNEGLPVAQAAKEAGVHETTVYGWLGKGAESVPSVLELSRLKRENKELLELVGELTLKLSTAQKKK